MNTALAFVFRLMVQAINHPGFQKVALKATRLATKQLIHAVGRYAQNRRSDYDYARSHGGRRPL